MSTVLWMFRAKGELEAAVSLTELPRARAFTHDGDSTGRTGGEPKSVMLRLMGEDFSPRGD